MAEFRKFCNVISPCLLFTDVPVSISIVLDGSNSVSFDGWDLQLAFVDKLLKEYSIWNTRSASIVQYSHNAFIELSCNDVAGSSNVAEDLENLQQIRGTSSMKRGLDKANEALNSATCGQYSNRRDTVVLFSDGPEISFPNQLLESANALKTKGVQILAIGVGSSVNITELALVTGGATNVYTSPSFEDLKNNFDVESFIANHTKPTGMFILKVFNNK